MLKCTWVQHTRLCVCVRASTEREREQLRATHQGLATSHHFLNRAHTGGDTGGQSALKATPDQRYVASLYPPPLFPLRVVSSLPFTCSLHVGPQQGNKAAVVAGPVSQATNRIFKVQHPIKCKPIPINNIYIPPPVLTGANIERWVRQGSMRACPIGDCN